MRPDGTPAPPGSTSWSAAGPRRAGAWRRAPNASAGWTRVARLRSAPIDDALDNPRLPL